MACNFASQSELHTFVTPCIVLRYMEKVFTSLDIRNPGLKTLPPGVERYYVEGGGLSVLEVLPEVVREREDNTLAVDYERMVALLIEAVKDLKKEVEELKQK